MKKNKAENNSLEEASMKKLDEVIKNKKTENEALKKLLIGLENLRKIQKSLKK